jgi:hypothetical protein
MRDLKVEFDIDSFFTIIFQRPNVDKLETKEHESGHIDVEAVSTLREHPASTPQVLKILSFCKIPRKRNDIQKHISLKDREHFRLSVLKPILEEELLEPLIPGKPQSSKQKYVTTEKGKQLLSQRIK